FHVTGVQTCALPIVNVVLNYRFGWTGSFTSLEAQALATIESPLMARGASPQVAYRRIAADRALSHAFDRVYGQAPSRETIADALDRRSAVHGKRRSL